MFLKERATVILVVDTSRSMQAEDVRPTRLGAAQQAIHDFLDQAPDRLNVGLVVFAGEAQVATPPTKDRELVGAAVDDIAMFSLFGGTAIGDALETAVEVGKQVLESEPPPEGEIAAPADNRHYVQFTNCEEQGPVSILFLSDGAQTRGILQPLEGAALAKDACIPVFTIALGTAEGVIDRGILGGGFPGGGGGGGGSDPGSRFIPVPPDPVTLQQIAEATGGEFSEARSADSLESAYDKLGSKLGREPGESEVTFLFVAIAASLLIAAGVLSTFVNPRLP
jgi:Ca-activated chloride channel family protein